VEQIFALSQVIEKSIEFITPVYVAFVDFTKAFDSIKLGKPWEILNKSSINIIYINLLITVYDGSEATIKTDISRFVKIKKGVKQGEDRYRYQFLPRIASSVHIELLSMRVLRWRS